MQSMLFRARRLAPEVVGTLLAVVVLFSARSSLADHYHVPTGSMQPSVEIGDRVVVDKRAYGLRMPFAEASLLDGEAPDVGDVVVLDSPEDGITLLKRVVATPGQTIAVRRGRMFLDGALQPIYESDGAEAEELAGRSHPVRIQGGGPDFGPTVVPADRFLVVGDNRGNSHDGRMFGFVERSAIRGRVLGVYWSEGRPTWRGL
jgi:signal peptidase I